MYPGSEMQIGRCSGTRECRRACVKGAGMSCAWGGFAKEFCPEHLEQRVDISIRSVDEVRSGVGDLVTRGQG